MLLIFLKSYRKCDEISKELFEGAYFMTKILFVCHGNICRSPMAEFVMKDLVRQAGLEWKYEIASAATSSEELATRSILLRAGNWRSTVSAARERLRAA